MIERTSTYVVSHLPDGKTILMNIQDPLPAMYSSHIRRGKSNKGLNKTYKRSTKTNSVLEQVFSICVTPVQACDYALSYPS
jgi:hypothetical protein